MPDDGTLTTHVTLRVPADVVEAFDGLARILDRPRSWVMVRALRRYLEEEAAEIFEHALSGPPGIIPETRRLVVGLYILSYRIRRGTVEIFAIRHSRQHDARQ